jgi:hypothetical protein
LQAIPNLSNGSFENVQIKNKRQLEYVVKDKKRQKKYVRFDEHKILLMKLKLKEGQADALVNWLRQVFHKALNHVAETMSGRILGARQTRQYEGVGSVIDPNDTFKFTIWKIEFGWEKFLNLDSRDHKPEESVKQFVHESGIVFFPIFSKQCGIHQDNDHTEIKKYIQTEFKFEVNINTINHNKINLRYELPPAQNMYQRKIELIPTTERPPSKENIIEYYFKKWEIKYLMFESFKEKIDCNLVDFQLYDHGLLVTYVPIEVQCEQHIYSVRIYVYL